MLFQAHRGYTPMGFLRRVGSSWHGSAGILAGDDGDHRGAPVRFEHLGRFSASYARALARSAGHAARGRFSSVTVGRRRRLRALPLVMGNVTATVRSGQS